MSPRPRSRSPRWYGVPLRVAVVTFVGTLLCFAVSLLFAIIGTVLIAALRHHPPDMRIAYRLIALPTSLTAGALILIFSVAMEVRHYRQSRALSAIERAS